MTIGLLLIVTKNAESEEQAFNGHFDDSLTDAVADTRIKRSLFSVASGMRKVLEGIKATRQLLRGAKRIISPRKGRSDYLKEGDYGTAIGDFFALRPTDIQDFNHVDGNMGHVLGKSGKVGNLLIAVEHRPHSGAAITKIIKGAGTKKQTTVKQILYVEPQKIFDQ